MHLTALDPVHRYGVIYADPPWSFRDKAAAGQRGAGFKYPLMPDNEILALPVSNLAADNSALLMWCPSSRLDFGLEVIEAWGFRFKTIAFTWAKLTRNGHRWNFGMGHWTRNQVEHVLLGIKGKPKRADAGVRQLFEAPVREHSRKPAGIRGQIETLFGDVPRIELFAREQTPGWDAWGNQSKLFDSPQQQLFTR